MTRPQWLIIQAHLFALLHSVSMAADPYQFEAVELPTQLQVGYAVRTVDVNGDGVLDITIVDSKRVLWLENPTWQEHVIYETPEAKFDNVTFAPHDINGDGLIDFAIGADWQFNNSDSGGSIGWLEHVPAGPWIYHPLANEPTTHRMNWVDFSNDGHAELIVAPLKGRGTQAPGFDQQGIRLLAFAPGRDPTTETWGRRILTEELHVMHNFEVVDLDRDGRSELITASYEGVTWLKVGATGEVTLRQLGSGQVEPAPKRGSSEIRHGQLSEDRDYLATIEPWHGDKVVVYIAPFDWQSSDALWTRYVIDDQLAWGHAIACANLDNDADEELIIGVRDDQNDQHRRGIRIYDPTGTDPTAWPRQLVDPGGVAVEDLTVADLDGDGRNDIVAVGRQTHNVKIYWNR